MRIELIVLMLGSVANIKHRYRYLLEHVISNHSFFFTKF